MFHNIFGKFYIANYGGWEVIYWLLYSELITHNINLYQGTVCIIILVELIFQYGTFGADKKVQNPPKKNMKTYHLHID